MAEQNVQMRINESRMTNVYANAFRQHANQHEVIVDMGVNVATKDQATGETTMNFNVDSRVVMNYVTAKRMASMLVQVVQAHEKQFGEIKID
ncbi:MAG: DUF3467 domain-containing protein [Phycisphaeraceae bacterium]